MGTLLMVLFRFVFHFDSVGGDYQTIALTLSLDTIALILFLCLRNLKKAS